VAGGGCTARVGFNKRSMTSRSKKSGLWAE